MVGSLGLGVYSLGKVSGLTLGGRG